MLYNIFASFIIALEFIAVFLFLVWFMGKGDNNE